MRRARVWLPLLLAAWLWPGPAAAEDLTGVVLRVIDGDTVRVKLDCPCCPKILQSVGVRVLGIDAPELKDRRPDRALLAREARGVLSDLCPVGSAVALRGVKRDKYGGRLVARVECGGQNVAEALKAAGLAREYWGRGPKPW